MNEAKRARWRLLGMIFLVIIVVHSIIIYFVVSHQHRDHSGEIAPASAPADSAEIAAVEPEVSVPPPAMPGLPSLPEIASVAPAAGGASPSHGGLSELWAWSKLSSAAKGGAVPPKGGSYRYRNPSNNPRFGEPFDFSHARRGDFKPGELPRGADSRPATSGIMVDLDTRTVLWEKNSSRRVPVASMVKMMTMLLVFEHMESDRGYEPSSMVEISREASKINDGEIWLDVREKLSIDSLLKATAIKSANDAAVQLAVTFGDGSSGRFVEMMNRRAAELGMTNTRFVSPCGLPDRAKGNSLSCAQDMVKLGEYVLEYPQLMSYLSTQRDRIPRQKFSDNHPGYTDVSTTNKLVAPRYPGVDGLKTGYIKDSGFCLTFSALRDGRRIVGCVTGFPTAKERDNFCRRLLDWGYDRIGK